MPQKTLLLKYPQIENRAEIRSRGEMRLDILDWPPIERWSLQLQNESDRNLSVQQLQEIIRRHFTQMDDWRERNSKQSGAASAPLC